MKDRTFKRAHLRPTLNGWVLSDDDRETRCPAAEYVFQSIEALAAALPEIMEAPKREETR